MNDVLSSSCSLTLNPQSYDDLINHFWKDCELRKFATARSYAITARRYCAWLDERNMTASAATKRDLKEYLYYMQKKKALKFGSIQYNFIVINCLYSYLEEEELIAANPVPAFVKRYVCAYKDDSDSERRQLISVEDAAKLVSATLETRDQAIIILFLKTGMRLGELAALDVSDVDMDDLSLTLKETAKRSNRLLYFDYETAEILAHWLAIRARRKGQRSPALILSNQGQRLSKQQVEMSVIKHAEVIGLHNPKSKKLADKFTPHCCRHWFTTHLLRTGMRREYVKWLRGDAIKEAVDIYYHIDAEDVRKEYMTHIPQLGV